MSAGDRGTHRHTAALIAEARRLLALPAVAAYLRRPYRVDCSHEMPLTGGSSVDGKVYFLDPKLKRKVLVGGKRADLAHPVLIHERVEKALRAVRGLSYPRAHELATAVERIVVEAMGLSWVAYKNAMASVVRRDEMHEHPRTMPRGYDFGPARESTDKSLRWLKRQAA